MYGVLPLHAVDAQRRWAVLVDDNDPGGEVGAVFGVLFAVDPDVASDVVAFRNVVEPFAGRSAEQCRSAVGIVRASAAQNHYQPAAVFQALQSLIDVVKPVLVVVFGLGSVGLR